MEKAIEVNHLRREYKFSNGIFRKEKKTTVALDDVSFEVDRGEIFGLLGPNGAGKTTTIKILTTLLAPTSGEVRVLGFKPFGEEKKLRPYINFIYGGERNLYWRISAKDNLAYFSDLYKIDQKTQRARIPELLELVGLTDRADERVENYSKGMKQRLQIARGLVNNPDILFLDEPTIGLDPVGAKELRDIIRKLSSQGKTIVLTTHYMYEADELCNRIAIIKNGNLVALDHPAKLKSVADNMSVIELKMVNSSPEKLQMINANPFVEKATLEVEESWNIIRIHTAQPSSVLSEAVNLFNEDKLVSVTTKEPTLEDVYVHYVGK